MTAAMTTFVAFVAMVSAHDWFGVVVCGVAIALNVVGMLVAAERVR